MKREHEFRDPIYAFINVRAAERQIIDSRPFQRLRHIHQLALTHLVYPGATHRRFEHSLGVMETATKIFDAVTNKNNILFQEIRDIFPDDQDVSYWRSILRAAALCHDLGHLPFSHAAEKELLPEGRDHESITVDIIKSEEMEEIWDSVIPKLDSNYIAKISVGPKTFKDKFSDWK